MFLHEKDHCNLNMKKVKIKLAFFLHKKMVLAATQKWLPIVEKRETFIFLLALHINNYHIFNLIITHAPVFIYSV